jgi:hypothetical protein
MSDWVGLTFICPEGKYPMSFRKDAIKAFRPMVSKEGSVVFIGNGSVRVTEDIVTIKHLLGFSINDIHLTEIELAENGEDFSMTDGSVTR